MFKKIKANQLPHMPCSSAQARHCTMPAARAAAPQAQCCSPVDSITITGQRCRDTVDAVIAVIADQPEITDKSIMTLMKRAEIMHACSQK